MNRKWREIWEKAEFWSDTFPDEHFDTPSSLASGLLARRLIRTASEFSASAVVEIGLGNGRVQCEMFGLVPGLVRLAIDIRPAPGVNCAQQMQLWDTGAERWQRGTGYPALAEVLRRFDGPILLFAVEWLDDLACEIAYADGSGSLLALGPDGPAGLVSADDTAWVERWWPQPGRLTVGRSRDVAWSWLARQVPPGSVLATIDYGHLRTERPADGGFAAYRRGQWVAPDPSANLTSAVAIDSLAAAVESLGCQRLHCTRLAELPGDFWEFPATDPLTALALRSQEQLLRDPRRFGDFWLVMHRTSR